MWIVCALQVVMVYRFMITDEYGVAVRGYFFDFLFDNQTYLTIMIGNTKWCYQFLSRFL